MARRTAAPKRQAKALAEPSKSAPPHPWGPALQRLLLANGPLTKADMISCLCFYERPQSWIFFVVGEGATLPPIVNLEMHRHVVFAVMLDHWIVVHLDLVDTKAAFLDPKSSDRLKTAITLKQMLVRWLEAHLGDDKVAQKLIMVEKKCEQHEDTSMVSIANIAALAQGHSFAIDTHPGQLRRELIRKIRDINSTSKPSRRLRQWTNHSGLQTADSMFELPDPSSSPLEGAIASLSQMEPPQKTTSSPLAVPTTRTKRKAEEDLSGPPSKRPKVTEKKDSPSWFFTAWWKKKKDLDEAQEVEEQLLDGLEKAKAEIRTLRSEMGELKQRSKRFRCRVNE